MSKKILVVLLLPIFYTNVFASSMKLEDIIIKSFGDANATVYMNGVVPSLKDFSEVRQKVTGRVVDINRSTDRYERKRESILETWQTLYAKLGRENIDFTKVKFIDLDVQLDQRISKQVGKDAARYIFFNFSQGDTLFTIKLKECIKFGESWQCGGGLVFSKVHIEESASSSSSTGAKNTR